MPQKMHTNISSISSIYRGGKKGLLEKPDE